MSSALIKFGTDGWRAVVARDYTFENVRRVAQATGQWLQDEYGDDASVVIGYDTRFQGDQFSLAVAQVLGSMGVEVHLADGFATTPAVSWATAEYGHAAGIVVTASHNPPAYNGFKIKAHFGGPASPEMIAEVERRIPGGPIEMALASEADLRESGMIRSLDLQARYVNVLRAGIDVAAIKGSGLRLAYDAMYGAGQGALTELFGDEQVLTLGHDLNPGMHGQAPEPIEKNLAGLSRLIVEQGAAVGLATDGDADRIGMYDETGTFVDSHKILALLVKYLHQEKGLSGKVVKTFSTTDMLDRIGEAYGLEVDTTRIGFKYIGPKMVTDDVLVGGEESGGMAVKGHIAERDGLYIGLTVVEMMVARGKKLSELVQELFDEFGPHYQSRNDLHTTDVRKKSFLKELADGGVQKIGDRPVVKTETLDGFKFRVDGGWLMFRPSGTEPVLRVYSEAQSQKEADAIVRDGVALVNG